MVEVITSATFDRWLQKLKDRRVVARVLIRVDRLANGNPGDKSTQDADIEAAHTIADTWHREQGGAHK